ncbi:MAG: thiamine-phosphate kinase [Candidatus Korarchaeota archaeon]
MPKLRDYGEKKLLESVVYPFLESPEFKNEDAVILSLGGEFLVMNIDTFVESTDKPRGMSYYDVGWRSVVMSASDVITKGALPRGVIVSITAPGSLDVKSFEDIIKGIRNACNFLNCGYYGGDLGDGAELVISVACFGLARKTIRRSGAKVGDSVWVTDHFGNSGLALHYLLSNGSPIESIDVVVQEFLRPKIESKYALALQKVATASMDSSDGLAVTLNDLASASGVAIELDHVPIYSHVISYANVNNLDPLDLALYAGEEFIIVFTSDRSDEEVLKVFKELKLREPIKVGRVTEGSGVFLGGRKIPRKGWEHFSKM